jgi:hypothetical protein
MQRAAHTAARFVLRRLKSAISAPQEASRPVAAVVSSAAAAEAAPVSAAVVQAHVQPAVVAALAAVAVVAAPAAVAAVVAAPAAGSVARCLAVGAVIHQPDRPAHFVGVVLRDAALAALAQSS